MPPYIPVPTADFVAMLDVLDLEAAGADTFVGSHPHKVWQRTFGGQLLAQAAVAAGRTVTSYRTRPLHALHIQFIRPGDVHMPINYAVERLRDERTLADRLVTARQGEDVLAVILAGFQSARRGLEHSVVMPPVPPPEDLRRVTESFAGLEDRLSMFVKSLHPIDIRYTDATPWELQQQGRRAGVCRAWMRADGPLPDDPLIHAAVLAWASDMTPLDPIITRHGLAWGVDRIVPATLNHSLWLHRPPRLDDWTLYTTTSPTAEGSRALVTGWFHSRSGEQIASISQEDVVLAYPQHDSAVRAHPGAATTEQSPRKADTWGVASLRRHLDNLPSAMPADRGEDEPGHTVVSETL
ncbi:acyl-CoA thioesterase [Nocardia alni]|uniref:acyl-CoA thioesterase n=1 Tax=Nocardia alni TaxID=2815723 RepID=UPI001C214FE7|nr:acyl-CoA thioesterase domain-containing protein [Nocardia alni]